MYQVPVIANNCCGVAHSGYTPAVLAVTLLVLLIGVALLGFLARRGKVQLGLVIHGGVGLSALALLWMWFAIEPVTIRYALWFFVDLASPFEALWLIGGALALAVGKASASKRQHPRSEVR